MPKIVYEKHKDWQVAKKLKQNVWVHQYDMMYACANVNYLTLRHYRDITQ